jgi:MFS family permease
VRRWIAGLYSEPWFFWLLVGFVANQASVNLLRPVTSYKALAMGVDAAALGALSAVYSLAPLAIMLRVGRLVDTRGEVPFIVGGTLLMALSGVAMAASDAPEMLYLGLAGLGLGQIIAVVAVQGMVARGIDESGYDRRFAAFSFSASIGQGLGPAIGGILVGAGSLGEISWALLVGSLISLLVLPMALLIRPPATKREPKPGTTGAAGPSLLAILRTPGILRALLVSTTVLSSIDILIIYLPALGEERLWPASLVGGLLGLRALSTMGTRVFLAGLAARYGRAPLLKWSMAIAAVALIALAAIDVVPLLVLIMIAAGAGLGIGQPLTMSWVASVAAPGTRATALAVRLMANRVGQVALPVGAGTVAAVAGAAGVLGVTGLIIGLSLAAVYGGLTSAPPATPVET